jgi:hypothetical protein
VICVAEIANYTLVEEVTMSCDNEVRGTMSVEKAVNCEALQSTAKP